MYVKEIRSVLLNEQEEMFAAYKQSYNFNADSSMTEFTAVKRLSSIKQSNQIREALMKGYVEMSQLNLSICRECLHAEYEAEHVVERLVSGG